MVDIADKGSKVAIINMFKELKGSMFNQVRKSTVKYWGKKRPQGPVLNTSSAGLVALFTTAKKQK